MIKRAFGIVLIGLIVAGFIIYPVVLMIGEQPEARQSPYSDNYNDLSRLHKDIGKYSSGNNTKWDMTTRCIVSSPTILGNSPSIDHKNTLYLGIGIEREYTQAEIQAIQDFVAQGGHAIIADDHGYANSLASEFNVLYYKGKLMDEDYDKNANFTRVTAHLGVDEYDRDGRLRPDGIWDNDRDGDGKVDEDPVDNLDNDEDNGRFESDFKDNDNDGVMDQPKEGFDEDMRDDDGDGRVDEEVLDGMDNDGDGVVDEDIMKYHLIYNDGTGLESNGGRVIAYASDKSFVDMNNDGTISIPDDESLKSGELADVISSPGHEVQLIVEIVVSPSGNKIDLTQCVPGFENEGQVVKVKDSGGNTYSADKIHNFGSIVFCSDPSMFTNDLYQLDHIQYDVFYPLKPFGNGWDDDNDGMIDEDREVAFGHDKDSQDNIIKPDNNLLDLTGDGSAEEVYRSNISYLRSKNLDHLKDYAHYDYHNAIFIKSLIYYLIGDDGLIIFDESRHYQDQEFFVPVYRGLSFLTTITSDYWYAFTLTFSTLVILLLAVISVKEKESWIHKFNLSILHGRDTVPTSGSLQTIRLRRAILERVRIMKGLSPEEFNQVSVNAIVSSVRDPQLKDLIQNEGKTLTPDEVKSVAEKIRKYGK